MRSEAKSSKDDARESTAPVHEADTKLQETRKPGPAKNPPKVERLENFLTTRGLRWNDETGTFIHPDGSVVRQPDGIFPWELVARDRVNPLWLATANMDDRNGLEIPAEAWNAAKHCDAVLLEPEGLGYREHHFSAIRSHVDAQILELYAVVYRIRVPNE